MRTFSALAVLMLIGACSNEPSATEEHAADDEVSLDALSSASGQLAEALLSKPGVVGVADGDCDGQPCIRVLVREEDRELLKAIPPTYLGYPVVVEVSGEVWAQE